MTIFTQLSWINTEFNHVDNLFWSKCHLDLVQEVPETAAFFLQANNWRHCKEHSSTYNSKRVFAGVVQVSKVFGVIVISITDKLSNNFGKRYRIINIDRGEYGTYYTSANLQFFEVSKKSVEFQLTSKSVKLRNKALNRFEKFLRTFFGCLLTQNICLSWQVWVHCNSIK